MGNYLYIDGGQVAYTLDGQNYSVPGKTFRSLDDDPTNVRYSQLYLFH